MTHSLFLVVLLGHIIGFAGAQPRAVLSLPSVFSDHMVLPAEPEVARVWGWTRPGDTVTLKIQFGNGSTLALPPVRSNSSSGRFEIAFTAAVSLAPSTIAIKNNNNTDTETTLQDVLFGTMILCGKNCVAASYAASSSCSSRALLTRCRYASLHHCARAFCVFFFSIYYRWTKQHAVLFKADV